MYVYKETDSNYEVGYYDPKGNWIVESTTRSRHVATEKVAWLNGQKVVLTCKACTHFHQHYQQNGYTLNCGHCTAANSKHRAPNAVACKHFVAKEQSNSDVIRGQVRMNV